MVTTVSVKVSFSILSITERRLPSSDPYAMVNCREPTAHMVLVLSCLSSSSLKILSSAFAAGSIEGI